MPPAKEEEELEVPEKGEKLLFRWSSGSFVTKMEDDSPADPDSTYVEMEVVAIKKAKISFE